MILGKYNEFVEEDVKMKFKYTVLIGIVFGVVANVLGGIVFPSLLGTYGIGLGALAACCGCLLGYAVDKKKQ